MLMSITVNVLRRYYDNDEQEINFKLADNNNWQPVPANQQEYFSDSIYEEQALTQREVSTLGCWQQSSKIV